MSFHLHLFAFIRFSLWIYEVKLESRTLRILPTQKNVSTKCLIGLRTRGLKRPFMDQDFLGVRGSHRTRPTDSTCQVRRKRKLLIPLLLSMIFLGLLLKKNRKIGNPKRALSAEEQAKKDFEKDMQQTLVTALFGRNQSWYILSVNQVFEAIHVHWGRKFFEAIYYTCPLISQIDSLRIGKLAEEARDTSVNLTNTGIAHQEVGWDPLRSFIGVSLFPVLIHIDILLPEAVIQNLGQHYATCSQILTESSLQFSVQNPKTWFKWRRPF